MQHCTDLPRQVTFPAHTKHGKDGTKVRMNVADHQEKNQKTGKRKAGEERRQAIDFKEAACCLSEVVQGGCTAKK